MASAPNSPANVFSLRSESLARRRHIEKRIREGDETAVPELVKLLEEHLRRRTPEYEEAALKAAAGLGRLADSGDNNVEELLIKALDQGKNRLQCAAAEALGRIGGVRARKALDERARKDKSATVRARAKMALRRLNLRGGYWRLGLDEESKRRAEELGVKRHHDNRTAEQIAALVQRAFQGSEYELEEKDSTHFAVTMTLAGGRTQTVHIRTVSKGEKSGGQYLKMYTACGPADPSRYEHVLKINFKLPHGALGLTSRGNEFVMVSTQLVETADVEDIRTAVRALAQGGDDLEKQLAGGADLR